MCDGLRFTDPFFWTEYFPPMVMKDLNAFGASVSWSVVEVVSVHESVQHTLCA